MDALLAEVCGDWERRKREDGRLTLLDLYESAAAALGRAGPRELTRSERRTLADRAMTVIWDGFSSVPGTDRAAEPIMLFDPDDEWPRRFSLWRDTLAAALFPKEWAIRHVGSTAVTGLRAKPIIDIQVSVPDLLDERSYAGRISSCGLELRSRDRAHRYFRPPQGRPRDVHVHVCEEGSAWERDHVLFRDYLRAAPEARMRYLAVKEEASRDWADDRMGYTEAKTACIAGILGDAHVWAVSRGWTVGRD